MAEFDPIGPTTHFAPLPKNKAEGPFAREEFLRWLQRQSVQFANIIITGTFKTAADGLRIQMDRTDPDQIKFFSGDAAETAHGYIEVTHKTLTLRPGQASEGPPPVLTLKAGTTASVSAFTFAAGGWSGASDIFEFVGPTAGAPQLRLTGSGFRSIGDGLGSPTRIFWGSSNPSTPGLNFDVSGSNVARFTSTAGHTLQGLAWTTFDPTFTNVTLGTGGSDMGRYVIIGSVLFWRMGFVLGTGGSVSGLIRCGYPGSNSPEGGQLGASAAFIVGYGVVRDDSTGVNYIVDVMNDVDNAGLRMVVRKVDGTYTVFADASGTVPMTWAVNDAFNAQGWYELNT